MSDSDPTPACPRCGASMPAGSPDKLCPACLLSAAGAVTESGAALPDITDRAEVARRLPQFEVLELLGRGGMGAVYKARQKDLDRIVALKILPPAEAQSPDFVERFRREARSLASLNHPNIVTVHECGEGDGLYYFVMEFVDGTDLRQLIRTRRLAPEEALEIVPPICDALQYAHEEGVVHRDIKPENILIDRRGRVKIADFGLVKLLRHGRAEFSLTLTGMALGTPRYMAPEQLDRPDAVDHRADIYSLGIVFYEMLTGTVPMGRFDPPSKRVQVDVKLDEIVLHAMEQEPDRRYQQVSEVKTAVERLAGLTPAAIEGLQRAMGREYRSRATLFGLPLLHVATGIDPQTGKRRVARGIIALGETAIGVFAAGAVAVGGVAFGAVSLGLLSFGGLAVGLLAAVGALGIGTTAFAGVAIGGVAVGGAALGWQALGGAAWGAHVAGSGAVDPEARAFFTGWGERWPQWLAAIGIATPVGGLILASVMWLALRSGSATSGWERPEGADASSATGRASRRSQGGTALPAPVPTDLDAVTAAVDSGGVPAPEPESRTATEPGQTDALGGAVRGPAVGLLVTGLIDLTAVLALVAFGFVQGMGAAPLIMAGAMMLLPGAIITLAGILMLQMRQRQVGLMGAVFAMIMPPGLIIGLPVGIWTLATLTRRDIRHAFAQSDEAPPEQPATRFDRWWAGQWPFVRHVAHSAINLACLVTVLFALSFSARQEAWKDGDQSGKQEFVSFGKPAPWLTIQSNPKGHSWRFHLFSSSIAVALGAAFLVWASFRIERAERHRKAANRRDEQTAEGTSASGEESGIEPDARPSPSARTP